MTVLAGGTRRNERAANSRLCLRASAVAFFVVTLISCNEHGKLRKVNVSVKEVNDWDIFTMAVRDEAGARLLSQSCTAGSGGDGVS